ncbi:lysine exporter LysO family protein [Alkaliphilus serpentinus]|uniref:Lysine exporter LysO family protein n=1 Tax=Alkaliphilus serpentinus TaxID=1482731 RepID=A0A833HMC8_9FIRM|nr:lysine exporter LysO family protein [Alkaliphilus serpentinus]KAB3527614.1 lysine exporter LysO family protein [Alkaliphilus serpentinus]
MTFKILAAVILGIITGYFYFPSFMVQHIGLLIDVGLCLLLLFVGIDIGMQGNILTKIKKMGFKVLLVPLMVAIGSIAGAITAGIFINLPFNEAGAIGAGFGWYSLSAIELSKHSAQLGTLAFITNVIREIIALITIPLIAKYVGNYEAIAPAGATAMDTTLPIISKSTDGSIAMVSFITGVVLSSMVPILVPLIMSLGGI